MANESTNQGSNSLPQTGGNIQDLLKLFLGGGSETTTEKSNITPEQMQAMIYQFAARPGSGVASIYGADQASGGYNSAMSRFAMNDLMTKAAAEAAQRANNQTTTVKKDPVIKTSDPVQQLAGVAALTKFLTAKGTNGDKSLWDQGKDLVGGLLGGGGAGSGGTGSASAAGTSSGSSAANFSGVQDWGNFYAAMQDKLSGVFGSADKAATADAAASSASGSLGPADMLAAQDASTAAASGPSMPGLGDILSYYNTGNDVAQNTDSTHRAQAIYATAGTYLGSLVGMPAQGAAVGNEIGKGWIGQQTDNGLNQFDANMEGGKFDPTRAPVFQGRSDVGAALDNLGKSIDTGLGSAASGISQGFADLGNSLGVNDVNLNIEVPSWLKW